ncbi:Uncharacterized protein DRE_06625 [Drechslerella stenobrocha 248]|uniref:21.2 kDa protein n=1 Tax=Drechslerella stenobrocha 248 TaxID=1043628 RepID=W7HKW1_9PEZI|nr:Uncharacterized protein DRE_06625 [Drechslerella stenobrocha 248]
MTSVFYPPHYPSLIEGTPYASAPPLSTELNPDQKGFQNPASETLSAAYTEFPDPIETGPGKTAFDVHVYYHEPNKQQKDFARSLWERIRHEFPELKVFRFWEKPIGPHLTAMFEVNLFTPAQFGAFIPWLMMHRGPLSVLVHPHTGDELHDHLVNGIWLGEKMPLDISRLDFQPDEKTSIIEWPKVAS